MRDINIISNLNPLIQFSSHRSAGFRDTFPWNLSQMFTKSVPIYKKSHKLHDEKDIPFRVTAKQMLESEEEFRKNRTVNHSQGSE